MLLIIKIITLILLSGVSSYDEDTTPIVRVEGSVSADDFVYYNVKHKGNLLLVLETISGDADFYISESNPQPNYYPNNYDYHSATCGLDHVYIHKGMKRPVAVGIYGYYAYPNSTFFLSIYQVPSHDDDTDEEVKTETAEVPSETPQVLEKKPQGISKQKLRAISKSLWPFLELFEMLFL